MVYNKGKKAVYAAVVIIILNVILTVTAAAAGEILWYYPPTPQGNVGIRKPTILWTFSGLSSDQVREINMTVDGQKVDAVFRDDLNSVYYKPQRSLMPGRRRVSIVVTLKSGVRISSPSFSFNILSDALDEVPTVPAYEEVRDRINYYRGITGLPGMTIEKSLNAAANSHALYVINNTNAGHYQSNKTHQYFTGEMPWDRTRYFGYMSPMVAENIHFLESHTGAVDDWMDSLYHRLPIINPIYTHMGYGYASKGTKHVNVLEVGAIRYNGLESHVVVYPADGQTGVPVTWSGLEQPDPFRLYTGAKGPGGYPITLLVSGDRAERVELKSATITDGGMNKVDFYSFDATNDQELINSNTIALIPKNALKPHTMYRVSITMNITYVNDEQEEAQKEWRFITGGGGFETYRPGDNIFIYLNGTKRNYSPAPYIKDSRVMVPIRSICEDLGAVVNWNNETYTVEIIREDNIITFDIGDKKALVNNRSVEIDVPAELFKDTTFVPVRFVSEVLGYDVAWDGAMRMVMIQGR
ncbi:MAG: stalk domain-containing protein [Clostridia bacterium]|jgi:uncharacterized protein YkwD|nr:hypothetical protein [Clostridiales bacterium]